MSTNPSARPIHRIAILGVGLLGGSFALALKKAGCSIHITGYDRPDVLREARARSVIDGMASSVEEAVSDADLVVLAAPIEANLRLLDEMAPLIRKDTLITDVGSVKHPMMEHAKLVLSEEIVFIGGHPMAGSEHSGVAHADALLFENATWALCPPVGQQEDALRHVAAPLIELVELVGARVVLLEAARHDRIAAAVSHLPQLLAVTLMNFVANQHAHDDSVLTLAAGGFRDMTRIASSPFRMWHDILRTNRTAIVDMLSQLEAELAEMRTALEAEQFIGLRTAFQTARTARETIPANTKGFLHPLSDVYVYIEDRPGALHSIIDTLFRQGHDIKDMELLKMREGTGGTFRLGFATSREAESAMGSLQQAAFTAFRL